MTEQLRQSLSAVIDGEADAFEMRRVLDEMDRDPALRDTWDRYHLIGSVIRGERTSQSRSAARVLERRVPIAVRESAPAANNAASATAAAEPAPRVVDPRRRRAIAFAVAASFVLAAVIAWQPFATGPSPGVATLATAVDAGARDQEAGFVAAESLGVTAPAQVNPRSASPADLRRAQAYMLQHAQQHGFEQRGVISLVKMASYEAP
jgi:sigma-E factor negative regulatory protein RseA